ncbi:MAG: hypothetical protein AAGF20_00155 [Pseudomonadota bacterium]
MRESEAAYCEAVKALDEAKALLKRAENIDIIALEGEVSDAAKALLDDIRDEALSHERPSASTFAAVGALAATRAEPPESGHVTNSHSG